MDLPPRYEFRVWDDDLEAVKERLEELGVHERSASGTELYLLSTTTDNCNAKIRADLLEVKRLLSEARGLQQWMPILKAPFPLESAAIAACLACLTTASRPLTRSAYTIDEFLDEVVAPSPSLVPVSISKRREIFSLDGCGAEFAKITPLTLPKATVRHSVAIESVDGDRLIELATRLDIQRYPNRSYVQEIKRLLHLSNG
jgi:exopolyphosphatase / guanosine-5'-triphosphate,3'-diphosphate pyrophosphatase